MSKANASARPLNEREQACLEHLREAQARKISFVQYCREKDLKVEEWYWVKQGLVRKGVLPAGRSKGSKPAQSSAGFAPVRLAIASEDVQIACRLRHPLGWTIECTSWPAAEWVVQLLAGERT